MAYMEHWQKFTSLMKYGIHVMYAPCNEEKSANGI